MFFFFFDGKLYEQEKLNVNSCNFENHLSNVINLEIYNENNVNIYEHTFLTFRNMLMILTGSIIVTLLFIFTVLKFSFQQDLHIENDQAFKLPEIFIFHYL